MLEDKQASALAAMSARCGSQSDRLLWAAAGVALDRARPRQAHGLTQSQEPAQRVVRVEAQCAHVVTAD
jgi:hypothetical protein